MALQENDIAERKKVILAAAADPFRALRELGVRPGLYQFLKMFWNEVAETGFKDNWHVSYLCKELEEVAWRVAKNQPRKHDLMINIPPGTTKTIICSIMFPAWCWSMGWYWMRFICSSYSDKLSLESAEKSRDLIRSDKFRAMYPDLTIKDDKDTKSNFRIGKRVDGKIKHGGNRFSTSVGGTLTGFHAHILIVDDPLNPEQAASEKELENCNRWMEQTLPTRKVDKEVSVTVLVMQRLHQSDPTGRALEKKKEKLRHICLPGILGEYEKFLNPPEAKQYYKDGLLDPIRLSAAVLKELEEDLGQYGYAGQIGQNPTPPGGGMFQTGNIATVERLTREHIIDLSVRYWDKAGTQGGGAYTAGVKMCKLSTGKFLILDVTRGQWGTDKRESVIKSRAEGDGHDVRIGVEQEPGSGGKESVESTILNLAGFSAHKDKPTGDKIFRADPFSVQVNEGNVLILKGDWNRAFIDELNIFPNGTYKDQVDAAAGAFTMLARKKLVRVIR